MELSPSNPGDHRLHAVAATPGGDLYDEDRRETFTAPGRPLDDLVDATALAAPLVVKMDIQGAEPLAFASGARTLARAALAIVEYWPYGMRRLALDIDDFHAAMAAQFSHGAIVPERESPALPALMPVTDLIAALARVGGDNPVEAIDIVLSRGPVLAAAPAQPRIRPRPPGSPDTPRRSRACAASARHRP